MIEITKGKPIPKKPSYPFATMRVYESFDVPSNKQNSVSAMACRYGKKHNKKFKVNTFDGVTTVWRIL